jgi:nucleoid-associated protein YgaU
MSALRARANRGKRETMRDGKSASSTRGTGRVPAAVIVAVLLAGALALMLRETGSGVEAPVAPAQDAGSEPAEGGETAAGAPAETAPAEDSAAEVAVEPQAPEPTLAEEPQPSREAEQVVRESPTPPQAPTVDEVRVDSGGLMVVAGRGAPGSSIDVLVDGEIVGTADVDDSGSFAALGTIESGQGARSLTLRATEGATTTASREEIILAPVIGTAGSAQQIATAEAEQAEGEAGASSEAAPEAALQPAPEAVTASAAPREMSEASPEASTAAAESGATEADAAPVATAEPTEPLAPEPDRAEDFALLRSDDSGVSLMRTSPSLPETVVLDTIGYSDAGAVQLSGRASAEAVEVRAYIDNRPVARLAVGADGAWRGEVPQIEPGRYTLRIDAVTADGTVASRIETPFQREAPAALAAADDRFAGGAVRAVTVQAGDTLWAIARERYGEGVLYVQVFEANRAAIRDPDLIYPGQVFELPEN